MCPRYPRLDREAFTLMILIQAANEVMHEHPEIVEDWHGKAKVME